ncbi:GTPase [Aerosakkonema sp. BLCC-F183]|uniref:GTPase n=1 Tax=Aerosakkonema sp. BLCC-F183 TaxID=3342834 RepID=UPI0035B96887
MTIKIAVAGHANFGKTTLIRTLMRMDVGEVRNSPNVTIEGEFYYYKGLQATFIDTPGFQHADLVSLYLEGVSLPEEYIKELKYDFKAIDVIKRSDVVIYLGNLSDAAKDSDKTLIDIIKRIQPKVVGVLNQYHKNLLGSNLEEVDNLCLQWTEVLNQKGIANVIVFDAHWDKRSKEKKIYDAICEILDDSQKAEFSERLNKFKVRQTKIREEVCETLAESVEIWQEIRVSGKKGESLYREIECREKIARAIYKETVKFIAYVSQLYEVAAEYPTDSAENLIFKTKEILKTQEIISIPGRLGMTTGLAAVFGTIGAIVGGLVGAVITGGLSGGLATIPGGIEGAKIFGAIGASLGSLAVFSDSDDRVNITITSAQIEDSVKNLLAIVWGLEHNGFGRGKNLSEDEAKDMKSQIEELHAKQKIDDWTKVNRGIVINYCKNILNDLENY